MQDEFRQDRRKVVNNIKVQCENETIEETKHHLWALIGLYHITRILATFINRVTVICEDLEKTHLLLMLS